MTFWVAFETILETVSEADPPRKGPRWAHAGHQELQSPKKLHVKTKTWNHRQFSKVCGVRRPHRRAFGSSERKKERLPRGTQRIPKLWKRNSKLTPLFFFLQNKIWANCGCYFEARILSKTGTIFEFVFGLFFVNFWNPCARQIPACCPGTCRESQPAWLQARTILIFNITIRIWQALVHALANYGLIGFVWPWRLFSTLGSTPVDCLPWEDHC